jgi:oligopeptide/dipeptide ABC transporter ATP-binding protein
MAATLEVDHLSFRFDLGRVTLFGQRQFLHAVNDVTFHIQPGETLGLVGESGCGKSTMAKVLIGVHKPSSGYVKLNGTDLKSLTPKGWRELRQKVQYVFQDPLGSLDPRMPALNQVIEPLTIHCIGKPQKRRGKAIHLLEQIGVQDIQHDKYPHQLSGGQRQRIVLARALILDPKLLVCDEPVSSLDVSIQAQVINLLRQVRKDFGLTMLFISHDLSVVRHLCHRVAVMYLGRIVELAECRELFARPRHPYTQALISAVPIPDPDLKRSRQYLEGEPPSLLHPPSGCHFHPRCPVAEPRCAQIVPELRTINNGTQVACNVVSGNHAS